MARGSASNRNEYLEYLMGVRRPILRADNLTTYMCWLSKYLEASKFWIPQALSRPVMGLLYLYLCNRRSQASELRLVTRLWTGRLSSHVWVTERKYKKFVSFSKQCRPCLAPSQPPVQSVPGLCGQGVKQIIQPSGDGVKRWSYNSTLLDVHGEYFTFT